MINRPQHLTHRARAALEAWGAAHPDVWRSVDECREALRDTWPSYVFLPLEQSIRLMDRYASSRGMRIERPLNVVLGAAELSFFSSWRGSLNIAHGSPAVDLGAESASAGLPACSSVRLVACIATFGAPNVNGVTAESLTPDARTETLRFGRI